MTYSNHEIYNFYDGYWKDNKFNGEGYLSYQKNYIYKSYKGEFFEN
jgi:hypothetical protein